MYSCPFRDETCLRKRCHMWINDGCVFLSVHTRLVEVLDRLDKIEEKIEGSSQESNKRD